MFDIARVRTIEFGVVRGSLRDGQSTLVPVDAGVQALLREMVEDTVTATGLADGVALDVYEPSQEHGHDSKLALALDDQLAVVLREFVGIQHHPVDAGAMREPGAITAYFCIMHDEDGEKLLAIRRAAQFKGVLEARLIQLIDDSFHAVNDQVFKLDRDFDLLIADGNIVINRVLAFEQLAEIEDQIEAAAVENVRHLEERLPFVEFTDLTAFVGDHKRAQRIVAALCSRQDLNATSPGNLRRECNRSGVEVRVADGKIVPVPGHELAFLQMLDRRRYAVSLIPRQWEQYEAASRKSAGVRVEAAAPVQVVRARRAPRAKTQRKRA